MNGSEPVQHSTVRVTETSKAEFVDVPGTSLDQIFQDLELERCDFLKMDCEGSEYEIIFGASDHILRRIKHIYLEYHDGFTSYSHKDLADFLQKKGFRVELLPNCAHHELGLLYAFNTQFQP